MQNWDSCRRKSGLVIVLSGPSGVGKDCVLAEFLKVCPEVVRCVTVTTRAPRTGEEPGVDYYFVSVAEFQRMIEAGEFLEYAEVHGNFYGSPLPYVTERMQTGLDTILKIDVQGALSVKRVISDAVMVFLVPPSLAELERRLRNRRTDSVEDIVRRLQNAQTELGYIGEYHYLIENDTVENAVAGLRSIVVAERSRISGS